MADLISKVAGPRTTYQFVTGDERFVLSLTRDFVALATPDYLRWEEFRDHLTVAVEALVEVYHDRRDPTRLGCRGEPGLRPRLGRCSPLSQGGGTARQEEGSAERLDVRGKVGAGVRSTSGVRQGYLAAR